ncbi:MAG TPA: acyl-[acyl-carrier-protein]--UDP-N-acetylglucosamine O-acyltransferase, partial [Thermoanaerobaculia bacterium]|nr:acyl-[acyl-carrier-protein]--UDP-N-acetylglucosamine O-acyltransferase [Thermoanaerobaculia bacterium]
MGGAGIHPLAFVDPAARLGDGITVGPFAVIGPRVEIGDGTEIGAGAQIQGPTRIGRENRIYPQAAIGFDPQDLKFQGEEVRLEIGDRNQLREFCTV